MDVYFYSNSNSPPFCFYPQVIGGINAHDLQRSQAEGMILRYRRLLAWWMRMEGRDAGIFFPDRVDEVASPVCGVCLRLIVDSEVRVCSHSNQRYVEYVWMSTRGSRTLFFYTHSSAICCVLGCRALLTLVSGAPLFQASGEFKYWKAREMSMLPVAVQST